MTEDQRLRNDTLKEARKLHKRYIRHPGYNVGEETDAAAALLRAEWLAKVSEWEIISRKIHTDQTAAILAKHQRSKDRELLRGQKLEPKAKDPMKLARIEMLKKIWVVPDNCCPLCQKPLTTTGGLVFCVICDLRGKKVDGLLRMQLGRVPI